MARGTMSDKNFKALLGSVDEMGAVMRGEKKPARVSYKPQPVMAEEIKQLRKKLHVTQAGFAQLVGEGEGAVQSWEQGVRNASGPAVKIIRLLEDMPQLKDKLRAMH
jgi:putative transcriptional regulator